MIEDTQVSEPSVETAPAETPTTSDDKIRSTMEAAFDRRKTNSPRRILTGAIGSRIHAVPKS